MTTKLFKNLPFLLFILLYVLYLLTLIYRSSFLINGEKHFVLVDDMMISMKYAKNLAEGHGLVWNLGERVEGITNPLWTFYMAFWHLFDIPASKISHAIQLTNVFIAVVNLFVIKKIAEIVSRKSFFVVASSVILTAAFYPLNIFTYQGMEVPLLSLVLNFAVLLGLNSIQQKNINPFMYLVLGLGTFIRMDVIVPYVAIGLFFLLFDKKHRVNHLRWGGTVLFIALFLQTSFRFFYYGDILPNTYYLKMTGYPILFRITRGLYTFLEYIWATGMILFTIPFVLLRKASQEMIILFFVFLSLVLYSIYVGGDAFDDPGRYITVGIPIFFILFSLGSQKILSLLFQEKNLGIISTVYLLICVVMFNATSVNTFLEAALLKTPSYVGGAKLNLEIAYEINKLTEKDATIAVTFAGIIPYFTERRYIDLMGKSDKRIARQKSREPYRERKQMSKYIQFFPGHTKWDNDYSIKERKPDVIVSPPDIDNIIGYLNKNYETVQVGYGTIYLKNGSRK